VSFHQQSYRNFKHFYEKHVCVYWRQAFPGLPSYQRFVDCWTLDKREEGG
jgi:hypothetical protein